MDDQNTDNGITQKIGSIVPQAYFDLIARVCPGVIVLFTFYVTIKGPTAVLDQIPCTKISLSLFLLVCLFGYAIAIPIGGFWLSILRVISRDDKDLETKMDGPAAYAAFYEKLKEENPSVADRITKLKAEIHMSGVLLIGLGTSGICSCIKSILTKHCIAMSDSRMLYGLLLIVLTVGCFFSYRYFLRRINNICNANEYQKFKEEFDKIKSDNGGDPTNGYPSSHPPTPNTEPD